MDDIVLALTKGKSTEQHEKLKKKNQSNDLFYVTHSLDMDSIDIRVDDVGTVKLPLSPDDVHVLINFSEKAKFGFKDQTILDTNVRDTHEISADKITVTFNNQTLSSMLVNMCCSMGLSPSAKLVPHLHNLLIYEKDQFFKEHQDSEKIPGMVATLIVVLPSAHIGGEFILKHNNQTYTFLSEQLNSKELKCFSFYADCHHSIEPVKQGYRVALTYNLILESEKIELSSYSNSLLEEELISYFNLDKLRPDEEPRKIVFYLEHDYTEHSLKWDLLKGTDRNYAFMFLSAAKKLNLAPHLALVDIHESWATEVDEGEYYGRSRYGSRQDSEPELDELIDDDTTLSFWVDEHNNELPYGEISVKNDEISYTKETHDFEPTDKEYEGWMGNYGCTMDYWYRRAAVVLWPKSDQILMNFRVDYKKAFSALLDLTKKSGNEEEIKHIIEKAGKDLYDRHDKNNFNLFVTLALYVNDEILAESLLSVFNIHVLEEDSSGRFVELKNIYGEKWCLQLMQNWVVKDKESFHYKRYAIFKNFDAILKSIAELGNEILTFLVDYQIQAIMSSDKSSSSYYKPRQVHQTVNERIEIAEQTLRACNMLNEGSRLHAFISHLMKNPVFYPVIELVQLFLDCEKISPLIYKPHYQMLKDYLVQNINEEYQRGVQSPDDWSIRGKLKCTCDLCKESTAFLKSKTEVRKVLSIVQDRRNHVIEKFDGYDFPVDLTIEKKGSPHKLVMDKTDQLHKKMNERFEKVTKCYEKLYT